MSVIAFSAKMGGEWYDIRFRYEPDLVTLIKTTIPSSFRKYDPPTKTWSASKAWAQAFAQAARHAGHITSGIPDPAGTPPPMSPGNPFSPPGSAGWGGPSYTQFFASGSSSPPPGSWKKGPTFSQPPPGPRQPPPMPPKPPPPALTENWARELMRRTPPELRTALYRAMSKVLHGDLGGDQALQQELNDARGEFDKGQTA